jgi:FkbH-like protein
MNSFLPWLPPLNDFSRAIRSARDIPDASERLKAVIDLAGHDRNVVQTGRLDRLASASMQQLTANGVPVNGLIPMRLAILSSHTVDHLVPSIRVGGLGRGVDLSIHVAPYGLYRQILLGRNADLANFSPQLVLLALDAEALISPLPLSATADEVNNAVAIALEDLRTLWRRTREEYGAQPIQQTLIETTPSLFGSYEGLVPASPMAIRARLNAAIRNAARNEGVLLLDAAWQMPQRIGDAELTDPLLWHHAKQLINPLFAPLYGDVLARIVAAVAGRSRKCLVLDLDNTLWGGVIGDDGTEGIKLGQGSADGEAFVAFQRYAARLAERGIILAICSKNDDAVARAAFETHPEMVLRIDDIACFTANWTDKATNLREIARRLNIGTDSLVFVDDNPAERAIIRQELPEVAVPEMPDDISLYPAIVAAAGYFEAVSLTGDDLTRNHSYAANTQRAAAREATTDMQGYLQSLEMHLIGRPIGPVDRPRAAQLINKSNQFNLTTRRRTEQELEVLLSDPVVMGYSFRLGDRFGDNGLISVVLMRPDPALPDDALLIDTWLMSCRVLGRGVEAAVLEALADLAQLRGIRTFIGEYRPTGRNGMVEMHYAKLGFVARHPMTDAANDACFWQLNLTEKPVIPHTIKTEIIS